MSSSGNLPESIKEILLEGSDRNHRRDPETFYASYLGFCPRHAYTTKLGLRNNNEHRGNFKVRRIIQEYIQETLQEKRPNLEVEPSFSHEVGELVFVGRPTAYNPDNGTVYHFKPRDGWYKFHPPVERHIKQLQVYIKGLDADRGRLLYTSMSDITDIKLWPPDSVINFDCKRFNQIVYKAELIRDEILNNGIPTKPEDMPFRKCGCYFCENEDLTFPEESVKGQYSDISSFVRDSSKSTDSTDTTNTNVNIARQQVVEEGISIQEADTVSIQTSSYHVPKGLRDYDYWVVWDCRKKVALAPWQEGNMYPCKWSSENSVNPRNSYEKAKMVSELPVERIHESWPFPDENDLPQTVKPAILLPHGDPEITVVDLDNIRNPETGEITVEAANIIDLLGGYTEVSKSGSGIHIYVKGILPVENMFSSSLEKTGRIEMYDSSRFIGSTWKCLDKSTTDKIPESHKGLNNLIEKYAPSS